jgi:hypothetical protein
MLLYVNDDGLLSGTVNGDMVGIVGVGEEAAASYTSLSFLELYLVKLWL